MNRVIGILTLIATLLVACGSDESPEAQIRARIAAMAEAAESSDVSELADGISDDYRDLDGHSKQDIVMQMRRVLLITRNLSVGTSVEALEVQTADFAVATVRARFTDVDIQRLRIDGEGITFELEWVLEGREWRIVSADWSPKHSLL
ncbi:MAG: hypothetical protein AAFN07_09000 [Pseudomonadota bacterium]